MGRAPRAREYANLPDDLKPGSIAEAYQAQEVYYRLAEPVYGPVGGVKVATTTKVMQQLMGITHPCGGAIFARTIHAVAGAHREVRFRQPARRERDRAASSAPTCRRRGAPWTRDSVAPFVAGAMPAYELIEDRNAVYTETRRVSMIVENCWNGGVVIGAPKAGRAEGPRRHHRPPDAQRQSRSARASPKTLSRRSPGSPTCSPSAGAISKPAWW